MISIVILVYIILLILLILFFYVAHFIISFYWTSLRYYGILWVLWSDSLNKLLISSSSSGYESSWEESSIVELMPNKGELTWWITVDSSRPDFNCFHTKYRFQIDYHPLYSLMKQSNQWIESILSGYICGVVNPVHGFVSSVPTRPLKIHIFFTVIHRLICYRNSNLKAKRASRQDLPNRVCKHWNDLLLYCGNSQLDTYSALCQNLIGWPTLGQENCGLIGLYWKIMRRNINMPY